MEIVDLNHLVISGRWEDDLFEESAEADHRGGEFSVEDEGVPRGEGVQRGGDRQQVVRPLDR